MSHFNRISGGLGVDSFSFVVAPLVRPRLQRACARGRVMCVRRRFLERTLLNCFVVFAPFIPGTTDVAFPPLPTWYLSFESPHVLYAIHSLPRR